MSYHVRLPIRVESIVGEDAMFGVEAYQAQKLCD
jgi:hypothetical protein